VRTLLSSIALLTTVSACGHEAAKAPALPVTVHTVSGGGAGGGVRYSASIRPDVQVDVAFKVSGYVEDIAQVRGADGRMRNLQDGDYVRRGTMLARIRDREYRDAVAQTEAGLTQAKADFDRVSQMFENRSASKADYDAAYAKYQANQAQHDQATQSLADCTLRTPLDGYVLRRSVEVGTLVAQGTAGFQVGDLRAVKVVYGVPDVLVGTMKLGALQSVSAEAVPGPPLRGRITRVAPSADASSRVFEVEVTIPNADGRLKPGMIASLQVAGTATQTASAGTLVPLNAVIRPPGDPTGYAVFVVDDLQGQPAARLRRVELGDVSGNFIRVTSGLAGGERVIIRGATLAVDSQTIRIIP
jgi:RND family efflux transporter MFP subunit